MSGLKTANTSKCCAASAIFARWAESRQWKGLICNRLPKLRMRKSRSGFVGKTGRSDAKSKNHSQKSVKRTASRNKANMPKRIYPCICSALKNLRRAENRFLHRRTKNYNCFCERLPDKIREMTDSISCWR